MTEEEVCVCECVVICILIDLYCLDKVHKRYILSSEEIVDITITWGWGDS